MKKTCNVQTRLDACCQIWLRLNDSLDVVAQNTICFDSDLRPLSDNLGLYFQIRDDYANLNSKEVLHIYLHSNSGLLDL